MWVFSSLREVINQLSAVSNNFPRIKSYFNIGRKSWIIDSGERILFAKQWLYSLQRINSSLIILIRRPGAEWRPRLGKFSKSRASVAGIVDFKSEDFTSRATLSSHVFAQLFLGLLSPRHTWDASPWLTIAREVIVRLNARVIFPSSWHVHLVLWPNKFPSVIHSNLICRLWSFRRNTQLTQEE
jgi:hypothetical protein